MNWQWIRSHTNGLKKNRKDYFSYSIGLWNSPLSCAYTGMVQSRCPSDLKSNQVSSLKSFLKDTFNGTEENPLLRLDDDWNKGKFFAVEDSQNWCGSLILNLLSEIDRPPTPRCMFRRAYPKRSSINQSIQVLGNPTCYYSIRTKGLRYTPATWQRTISYTPCGVRSSPRCMTRSTLNPSSYESIHPLPVCQPQYSLALSDGGQQA